MTDIVERLRNRNVPYGWPELADKAADEIERLKREYPYSELDMDMHVKAMTKDLRDEIEQLRAALKLIADIAEGSTTANSLPNIARIARRHESVR